MIMNMLSLQYIFEKAIRDNCDYVGIKVAMQGFEGCEIIINPRENFKAKFDYYKKAYNNDLTLKTFNGIRIINAAYGTISDIEQILKED